MEALSIQSVKANYRPAGTQAQSGFGDIFQAMLRDSAERSEQAALPPRVEDRPEPEAPRRTASDERTSAPSGDLRDQPYEKDTDNRVDDVSGAGELPAYETTEDRDATQAVSSDVSDQPSDTRGAQDTTSTHDDDATAPKGAQAAEEQIANTRAGTSEPVLSGAVQVPVAPNGDNNGQANKSNAAAALPGTGDTSGKAAGVPTTAPPVANQTQNPASAPTAPKPAGGNGIAAQVTVTPGQVVATPSANLGGGATTAALSAANNPDLTTPATPNTEPANRTTQGAATQGATTGPTPASNGQSPSGADRPATTTANAQIAQVSSADGQAAATQAASANAEPKRNAAPADSQPLNGNPPNGRTATADKADAPIRTGLAGPAQDNATQVSSGTPKDLTSQTDSAKITNTQTAAPQGQADQAPKIATAATPQATAAQGAQAEFASALAQGSEPGSRAGSTGSTDTSASRASSVPTGGFTQAAVRGLDTLGSLTQSSGSQPTPSSQAAVEIVKAINTGKDHIRIRLSPAELGQIDVSLKVRHDGTVKVVVTTDRPETFDLMQRDSRGLERALQDAGLKTDSGSLSFNLRGGDQHGPNDGQRGSDVAAQSGAESEQKADSPPPETDHTTPFVSDRALDMRV